MTAQQVDTRRSTPVRVPIGERWLPGDLGLPAEAHGIVLFAHGTTPGPQDPAHVRPGYVGRVLWTRPWASRHSNANTSGVWD